MSNELYLDINYVALMNNYAFESLFVFTVSKRDVDSFPQQR